ncbi:hypothetical protein ACJ2_23070 [Pantoea sp. QMID2]|nr:hypothetical protein ACJ3_10170 [Pantoea sp. QMID3]GME32836.1 hypothetical protein ACJ1_10100 [Pantoea sp. QMID1]GME56463.1 hypothetical protein ACJ4_23050 [Pantoea sp. QMID4]GME57612.1 hypothetical protein ACJ2_23070 [Pantoea sp. QMID2]
MIIRHAIDELEADKKQQVLACSAKIRAAMQAYDSENAGLALMLVAAEVAAE